MRPPKDRIAFRLPRSLRFLRHQTFACLIVLLGVVQCGYAQTPGDLDVDGNQTINVLDLIAILESDPPPIPNPNLLFLLAASWAEDVDSEATPTATGPGAATATVTGTPTLASTLTATSSPSPTQPAETPTATSTVPAGETFNLRDYFPLVAGSEWHYIGFNGAGSDGNFTMSVNATDVLSQPVGDGMGGVLNTFDLLAENDPGSTGPTDISIEQYHFDAQNDLYFFPRFMPRAGAGEFNCTGKLIHLGGDGITIGSEFGGVFVPNPPSTGIVVFFGGFPAFVDEWESRMRFTAKLPFFDTPLGRFENVLRIEWFMRMEVTILGNVQEVVIRDKTIFLAEGVGIIAHDFEPDPDDQEIQAIDSGMVGGVPIEPDLPPDPNPTSTTTRTPTVTATPTETLTPTATATATAPSTFDILNYFPTSANSNWHYEGIRGATRSEAFTRTVEPALLLLPTGDRVRVFRTDTDSEPHPRDEDFEYWRQEAGELLYFGGGGIANIIGPATLSNPIVVGQAGMMVGQGFHDSGAGTAFIVGQNRPITVTSTVQYTDVLPNFETPLGTFNNVLRVEVEIIGTADLGIFNTNRTLFKSTLFLRQGAGIIAQDFEPDPDDLDMVGIDMGTVFDGGSPMVVIPP